jgi:hypothetical protein
LTVESTPQTKDQPKRDDFLPPNDEFLAHIELDIDEGIIQPDPAPENEGAVLQPPPQPPPTKQTNREKGALKEFKTRFGQTVQVSDKFLDSDNVHNIEDSSIQDSKQS